MRRFVLLFVLLAGIGFSILIAPFAGPAMDGFTRGITSLSGAVIHFAGGRAEVHGDVLAASAGGFSIRIINGCNGIHVLLLLWAAILAYPTGWGYRLKGMFLGSLIVQGVNTVRIISLLYLGQWNRTWFEWMHMYIWEALIMVVGLAVFVGWVRGMPLRPAPESAIGVPGAGSRPAARVRRKG